jgi:hypothetical protein
MTRGRQILVSTPVRRQLAETEFREIPAPVPSTYNGARRLWARLIPLVRLIQEEILIQIQEAGVSVQLPFLVSIEFAQNLGHLFERPSFRATCQANVAKDAILLFDAEIVPFAFVAGHESI